METGKSARKGEQVALLISRGVLGTAGEGTVWKGFEFAQSPKGGLAKTNLRDMKPKRKVGGLLGAVPGCRRRGLKGPGEGKNGKKPKDGFRRELNF